MRIINLPINFVKFSIKPKQALLLAVVVVSVTALIWTVPNFISRRSSAHGVNTSSRDALRRTASTPLKRNSKGAARTSLQSCAG